MVYCLPTHGLPHTTHGVNLYVSILLNMLSNNPRNDDNPYKHIRQKTNDQWWLYWLCEDKEFRKELEDLNDWMSDQFDAKDRTYNPPKSTYNKYAEIWDSIKEKYGVTEDELAIISTGLHLQYPLDFPFEDPKHASNDSLVIAIPRNIKKAEYIAAWDYINELFNEHNQEITRKRNRASENPELVYAIYKARKRGNTFRKIFEDYQNGVLDCYSREPTLYYQEALERFYQKYKPDR